MHPDRLCVNSAPCSPNPQLPLAGFHQGSKKDLLEYCIVGLFLPVSPMTDGQHLAFNYITPWLKEIAALLNRVFIKSVLVFT